METSVGEIILRELLNVNIIEPNDNWEGGVPNFDTVNWKLLARYKENILDDPNVPYPEEPDANNLGDAALLEIKKDTCIFSSIPATETEEDPWIVIAEWDVVTGEFIYESRPYIGVVQNVKNSLPDR